MKVYPFTSFRELLDGVATERPDVVFVAVGSPRQELLVEEMRHRRPAIYQRIGGSFDVCTGRVGRASRRWLAHNQEFLIPSHQAAVPASSGKSTCCAMLTGWSRINTDAL